MNSMAGPDGAAAHPQMAPQSAANTRSVARPAAGVTATDPRDWHARAAERFPILAVMPLWLMASVVILPAVGFWLGVRLHAQPPAAGGSGAPSMTPAAASPAPVFTSVGMRRLRFLDAPDKSVQVLDADTGTEVYRVVGEAGFVRGILRGMARERRRLGKSPGEPFELSLEEGLLTLRDLATGQRVELTAFGHTNAGAFARMLVEVPPRARPESGGAGTAANAGTAP